MSVILALNLFAAIGLLFVVVMIQGLAYNSRGAEHLQLTWWNFVMRGED